MPSQRRHLAIASNNEDVSQLLQASNRNDWAVTVVFYAALHLVDSFFATAPFHPSNHTDRLGAMARSADISAVYAHFQELYDRSLDARYYGRQFSDEQVNGLREHLRLVKERIQPLTGLP